jgi:hypothetical protein
MNDFSLNTSYGSLKDEVLLIIQQLDILFDTNQGDVLGDENFGTQYDKYLHNLKISNEGLRHEVMSDLSTLELFGWVPDVEVYLLQGSQQDIALINIKLYKEDKIYEKTYKIA